MNSIRWGRALVGREYSSITGSAKPQPGFVSIHATARPRERGVEYGYAPGRALPAASACQHLLFGLMRRQRGEIHRTG